MKIILIIISSYLFTLNQLQAEIIYNKNNNVITLFELNEYSVRYKEIFNEEISREKAIKNIILMNNTINNISKENEFFLKELDQIIIQNNPSLDSSNKILFNMIRFIFIKNNFISEYFQNNLKTEDIIQSIEMIKEIQFPLSSNECLTVDKFASIDNKIEISNSLYQFYKNKIKPSIKINEQRYDLCLDNKTISILEKALTQVIESRVKEKFTDYIYRSVKENY